MGEKLDDSRNSGGDEKDVNESMGGSAAAILDNSGSSQEEAMRSCTDRRIVAAQHSLNDEGLVNRLFRWIFYLPMRVLSFFGFTFGKAKLHVSGNAKIDNSPLRPASTSPQKRKRDDRIASTDDEIEDTAKLLQDDEDYDSQADEDFKPGEESSCSDEYGDGDTEGELSKLSIEDVTEPRPSALRNITDVDHEEPAKSAEDDKGIKTDDEEKIPAAVVPKCIDHPLANPDLTPSTVGVMG